MTKKKNLKLNKTELLELNLIHTQRQLTAALAEKAESVHNQKQETLLNSIGKRLGIKPGDFVFRLDTGEVNKKE